jgi:hypothetical protein
MVHKTSSDQSSDPVAIGTSPSKLFQVWKDGSLASFPGIPNLDPKAKMSSGNRGGIRGKVVSLSDTSRRNLMLYLAKMSRHAQAYTMTLTLPGDFKPLSPAMVHLCFKKLSNRLTACRLFSKVGFVWKRELQKRGALHYHLLLYGLEGDETRHSFQCWMAKHWNALVCANLSEDEAGKHLRWHNHPKNMDKVRGNIAGYFAKYLGKPLETVAESIPGRWWGKVNGDALPVSACVELPLPLPAAVLAHRVARKILKKRADEARHYRLAVELNVLGMDGKPIVSQFGLLAAKGTNRTDMQKLNGAMMDLVAKHHGKRWGKAPRRGFGKYSRIRLISRISPTTAIQIMRYVDGALRRWVERTPF